MKTNKIQNVVRARLAGFAAKIAEITEIEHSSTNGDLRETVLKDLVTSVLPKQFSVRSGFICDVLGGVSRQLDLVVVDNTCTPEILLQGDAAFIPVEAALVVIEIKATIKTGEKGTLEQVKKQIDSVVALQPMIINGCVENLPTSRKIEYKIPFLVFGFSSDVSKDNLLHWLNETQNLNGICVFQREYQWKSLKEGIMSRNADGTHSELLLFASSVVSAAETISAMRIGVPRNMYAYIEGV